MGLKNGDLAYGRTLSGDEVPILADTSNRLVLSPGQNFDSDFTKSDSFTKVQSSTVTASGTIKATPGFVAKVIIIATASGTFRLRDGGASGTIKFGEASNAVPTAAGTQYDFGGALEFATDIYFELVAGTLAVNVFYI